MQDAAQDNGWSWRATDDGVVHRDDVGDTATARIADAEDSTARCAVADGNDQFGVGNGIIRAPQRLFHIH